MTAIPDITTGDSISLAVTLKKSGATFIINPAAVVKAALVSSDHKTAYTSPVTQSSATPGAAWATSLVVVELPSSATADITFQGLAILEIQVVESSVTKTWFVPVRIITGQIP